MKIACVHWIDASHYGDTQTITWLKQNASLVENITVGHVLQVNRKQIILAHEISNENQARNTTVIRRRDIIKIEYLGVK